MGKSKKKVVKTKSWTFKWQEFDDGTSMLTRANKGFNIFELAGLAELAQLELMEQFKGNLRPTQIKRKYSK